MKTRANNLLIACRRSFLTGLLMIFTLCSLNAQSIEQLLQKSDSLIVHDHEQAILIAKLALRNAINLNDDKLITKSYISLGRIYVYVGEVELASKYFNKIPDQLKFFKNDYLELAKIQLEVSKYKFIILEFDSALTLANQAVMNCKLSHKKDAKLYEIKSNNVINSTYYRKGDVNKATQLYLKTLEVAKKNDFKIEERKISFNLTQLYLDLRDYSEALKYAQYSKNISEELGDEFSLSKSQYILGRVFSLFGDYEEGLKYLFKSEDFFRSTNNVSFLGFSLLDIGQNYVKLNEPEKALTFLKEAMHLNDKACSKGALAKTHAAIANAFVKLNNYDSATTHAKKGCDLAIKIDDQYSLLENVTVLSELFYMNKKFSSAKIHAKRALGIAEEINNYKFIQINSNILFNVYEEEKNSIEALYYLKKVSVAHDSIMMFHRVRNTVKTQMTIAHENEKSRMIVEREKEELMLKSKIEQKTFIQNIAIGSYVIIVILAIIFFKIYKRKRIDNQLLAEKNSEIEAKNHKLLELSKYKQGLTHMIAHDMKNPLNAIIGLAHCDANESNLKQIKQSGKLMLQMITNMLDVQKFEEMKMRLNKKPNNLSLLIGEAKHQIELNLVSKGMIFKNLVDTKVSIEADFEIMTRVLVNIFTNAIKYSKVGGVITINSKVVNDSVNISIIDEGKGIDAEKLPFIFDKFWQADSLKSFTTQSTGLGLTFCKMALEAHDGTISAYSNKGQGTEILLTIKKSESVVPNCKLEKCEKVNFLTVKDLDEITPFVYQIKSLPLYKVGEINKVLEDLQSKSSKVEHWKKHVKEAVFNWDEDTFMKLMNLTNLNANQINT